MNKIVMTEGVSGNIKNCLQSSFDYLTDCEGTVSDCKVLTDLDVDNGSNDQLKKYINDQKSELDTYSNQAQTYEENILDLDIFFSLVLDEIAADKKYKPDEVVEKVLNDMGYVIPSDNEYLSNKNS